MANAKLHKLNSKNDAKFANWQLRQNAYYTNCTRRALAADRKEVVIMDMN